MLPLTSHLEFKIKFNEADVLGIVWHGHYIRFFEDGREAFGDHHGLAYMDIYEKGFIAPVVSVHCDYKKPLEYGDIATVETTFIDHPAAKIVFNYRIMTREKGVVAEGNSVQVFLDKTKKQLQLIAPEFFLEWKNRQRLMQE